MMFHLTFKENDYIKPRFHYNENELLINHCDGCNSLIKFTKQGFSVLSA